MGFSSEKLPDTLSEKCRNSREKHMERATCVETIWELNHGVEVDQKAGVGVASRSRNSATTTPHP